MKTPRGTARALRRLQQGVTESHNPSRLFPHSNNHEFDHDAICIHCGFDGAEWWHWKHNTYEGRASDAKQPACTMRWALVDHMEDLHREWKS